MDAQLFQIRFPPSFFPVLFMDYTWKKYSIQGSLSAVPSLAGWMFKEQLFPVLTKMICDILY